MSRSIIIEMEGNKRIVHPEKLSTSCINYKNKKIRVIVDNEEIYIINMILPKANKEITKSMIKDELGLRFKNLDSIMFDYVIFKKNKINIEAAVFCFNWNRGNLLKELVEKGARLIGVYPLQLYILKKLSRKIKDKSFYFIFLYGNSIYFMTSVNNFLVMNGVFKNVNNKFEKINITQFKDKINILYYANIDKEILKRYIQEQLDFVDLGYFQHTDIFA